ncbi:OmpA family protein [Caulobacter sp. 17J65-9]|uniref:OmpA family protein n=1 Tax=Caulobacter sp. 17J65-9 TaxID=2709382 RepID=UPI0013C7E53E|nr:OmpA family protein [Caulobacter sp. 17J65-9]NEX92693.1 OmpA family protein [Caulobacter sp. 17J65-9]
MNLWNELKASITGDTVDQVAAATGESVEATRRGLIGAALPAVLTGAVEKFSGEAGAVRLLDEARAVDPDGTLLDDFGAAVRPGPGADTARRVGQGFLGNLFGARTDAVADVVANHAGIRKSSASALMAIAAPLFLGFISKRARTGGLDARTLAGSLRDTRNQLPSIAPAGLLSTLGFAAPGVRTEEPMAIAAAGRPKWLPWVIAALVVLALLALVRTCGKHKEVPPPVTAPAPAVEPATPAVATEVVALPNGTQLTLRPSSLTYNLAAYLKDPAAPPPPRRFTFEQLNFDTASNALDAASLATIDELAAILTAYPNAVVVVEGHTDNVGEPAANMELSKRRAEAVRDALYAKGVAKERASGVGYGETKPIASNDTEEGRAKNRRTDLVVTKK